MILKKEKEKPSPSYSPIIFTNLKFLVFSPPLHFPPFHSDSNISNLTLFLPQSTLNSLSSFFLSLRETMRRRPRATFLVSFLTIIVFAAFSLHLSRNAISGWKPDADLRNLNINLLVHRNNNIVNEFTRQTRRVSSIKDSLSTVSVLLPDWEILVIVSPNTPFSFSDQYYCIFPNNAKSHARFSGVLPSTNQTTFKCDMPESVRRHRMFSQPKLVVGMSDTDPSPAQELIRWNFLVYESFSTDDDVVLFAKGVNHRKGYDRSPKELRCVFDLGNGIRKAVTSSVQEVFRCPHPDPSELGLDFNYQIGQRIGVSIEIVAENIVVPSVAYYTPRSRPKSEVDVLGVRVRKDFGSQAQTRPKHSLCACTMVYNVAKFLREWVTYHSKVGVENFILYDNASDDDLYSMVEELRAEGYNISTLFWMWPKTQEAGFSHSVLYSKSKGLCNWIMYVDVDEFVFSPSWGHGDGNASLKSLLPKETLQQGGKGREGRITKGRIGQVSIRCLEFGPSGQRNHPVEGVTQGYTCRRKVERRHKSMVLVDAVDRSLRNVIHHFQVKEGEGFRSKQVSMEEALVNHYKYQAWDEFKRKFRRRVSAYVVDWTQNVNLNSKDRTPGLGFQAIEPKDWRQRFCEVRDERLKSLTRAWFGSVTTNGYRMSWQSS